MFERGISVASFNELYRKYVGPLPSDTSTEDDEGMEEALYPIEDPSVKVNIEMEEEEGLEM